METAILLRNTSTRSRNLEENLASQGTMVLMLERVFNFKLRSNRMENAQCGSGPPTHENLLKNYLQA